MFAAQDTLTWFLKIEPWNTTLPNDTSTEFASSSLANFPVCNLTTDERGSPYQLIGIRYPHHPLSTASARHQMASQGQHVCTRRRYVEVKSLSKKKKIPIELGTRGWTMDEDGDHNWTMLLTSVTLPHSLLLSPSYLCTTSQCFHTKSIGTV